MIKFYSTGCPQCKVLQMKLDKKNVPYDICTDTEEMKMVGLKSAPALNIDGMIFGFADAIRWVNEH